MFLFILLNFNKNTKIFILKRMDLQNFVTRGAGNRGIIAQSTWWTQN